MIFLSDAALKYAVDICLEKPQYRVGVAAYYYTGTGSSIIDKLRKLVPDASTQFVSNSVHRKEIYFKNGSIIKIIPASDSSRGGAFHILIVDEEIPPEILQQSLLPTEKGSMYEYYELHRSKRESRRNSI